MIKRFFSVLGVMTLIAGLFVQPASAQGPRAKRVPPTQQAAKQALPTNGIIVKFKEATGSLSSEAEAQQTERLSAAAGVTMRYFRAMSGDAQVWKLPERLPLEEVQRLSERLMSLPDVEYAEPDQIMEPTLTPNDARYGEQWHYSGSWGINAPAAWNITTGLSSTVVAVIDTGITNHADLSGRTVPGYDFISDAWMGNDGNGRDNNASDPGNWTNDDDCALGVPGRNSSWHGTHVAGTIGANSNNGIGVSGINWNAKILPVRVLGRCGGLISDIADAMLWAAGLPVAGVPANPNPAKVLNLSLGGGGDCGPTYQGVINSITAAGVTVVVAAGNENADASQSRPANCNGVITVAATDIDGFQPLYSNFGATVEISAPGGDVGWDGGVLSTIDSGTQGPVGDTYAGYDGTSMATPHVAGVISLMLARNPYLTPAQVLQILQSTARPFRADETWCNGTGRCGPGIVDALAALNATPVQTFADVPGAYWSWSFIERLYKAGITGGCSTTPAQYCPEGTVTRAQMAVFLLRGIHTSAYTPPAIGATSGFNDVPISYWSGAWIKQLAAEGITTGCGGGNFCPENPVTRAQMAVFLLRSKHGTSYVPPGVGAGTGFGDVPPDYWAATWIKQLVTEGITTGCGSSNYCPENPVTRAQMAVFLVRTFNLP
jgi:serine protease